MSTYHLDRLFAPRSIAVIGASPRPNSLGRMILTNIVTGGFAGDIHVVNPRHTEVDGFKTCESIAALPAIPDLVVIATPPATVPELVAEAGTKGIPTGIIITAGLGQGPDSLAGAAERAARAHGMRLVGPNCLGVLVPPVKLNASFTTRAPNKGDLVLISQSGAVAAGLVEWAASHSLGFSAVVSLGDKIDVDFGDCLDYFATDRTTRAILLYIESITDARKFLSAARAAARVKPVVVIKAGRHAQGAKAASTHTGALAGSDDVYDAAFHRAGLLRVYDLNELYDAAETLARTRPFRGDRLAILTNGGGIGVLAVDRLIDLGGTLAALSPDTVARLDGVLPATWSRSNPVDIIGDADAERYAAALATLFDDPANDAILVINVPTMLASPTDAARRVVEIVKAERAKRIPSKPVFAVWIGEDPTASTIFANAGIPSYPTEAAALSGIMHLVHHAQAQRMLMETPPSLPAEFQADLVAARRVIDGAIADGRTWLDPIETVQLIQAYGISIASAVMAHSPDDAAHVAAQFLGKGDAVAVKILSRDIVHKSDVDGVRLNLKDTAAVSAAAKDIIDRARSLRPDAYISGVTVHPMIARPQARELIAGIASDPTFGPVVVVGHGGTAVEVINDKALSLPPLDLHLAQILIGRTHVSRLLKAHRNVPAARESDVALVLVKLSQLAADLPEVQEIDINPLLVDDQGAIALDARIAVKPIDSRLRTVATSRFAIRPYPKEWERRFNLPDDTPIFARPVRPEDEPMFDRFFERVTHEDLRLRFFAPVREITHTFVARLTQLDYARAMAFVAIHEPTDEMVGIVRLHSDANYENAEYAILLRSDWKGRGLGWKLMKLLIDYAHAEGLRKLGGQVLAENQLMLDMCKDLGFQIRTDPDDPTLRRVDLSL